MQEKTRPLGDSVDWVTKLFYYIEKRDEIYTENDKLEQIRLDKEERKTLKKKMKAKGNYKESLSTAKKLKARFTFYGHLWEE